jgi:hypothetical protein
MRQRDKFPLAHMLLRLWERYETGAPCARYAGDIGLIDAGREKYRHIPSLLG